MSKQSICTIWCQYFRSSSFKCLTNLVSITTIIVSLAQGKGIRQIEELKVYRKSYTIRKCSAQIN